MTAGTFVELDVTDETVVLERRPDGQEMATRWSLRCEDEATYR